MAFMSGNAKGVTQTLQVTQLAPFPWPALSSPWHEHSSVKTPIGLGLNLQTEGGGDRNHERQMERLRVAEGGADRVHERQLDRMHVAEGGGRLSERQKKLMRTS